jgi:hypothetical protein
VLDPNKANGLFRKLSEEAGGLRIPRPLPQTSVQPRSEWIHGWCMGALAVPSDPFFVRARASHANTDQSRIWNFAGWLSSPFLGARVAGKGKPGRFFFQGGRPCAVTHVHAQMTTCHHSDNRVGCAPRRPVSPSRRSSSNGRSPIAERGGAHSRFLSLKSLSRQLEVHLPEAQSQNRAFRFS